MITLFGYALSWVSVNLLLPILLWYGIQKQSGDLGDIGGMDE